MVRKIFQPALLLLASIVLVATTGAQDPPTLPQRGTADPAKITSEVVALTTAWIDGKLSTGGLSGEFREISKSRENGKVKAVYNVYVKGATPDKVFAVLSWPIDDKAPREMVKGASVTSDGLLVCAGRAPDQCGSAEHKDDPLKFTLTPRKGEITRVAVVSPDKTSKATFGIVPDPITHTDRGCRLEVVRLAPKFEVAMVRGHGFKPGESIDFSAKSFSESQGGPVKADDKGEFSAGVTPYVKGKLSGTTVVKLSASHCAPEVSFAWGR